MARYHVNKNGNPGPCKAMVNCPFGDMEEAHYDTPQEAREAYEAQHGLPALSGLKKNQAPYPAYLTPALVAKIPTAPDGTEFEDNWRAAFSLVNEPTYPSVHTTVDEMLGSPNFGRPRSSLVLVRVDTNGFYPYDKNEKYPDLEAGVYPVDAPEAQHLPLMANIHTRNGGGNRECYCEESEHTPDSCTAAATEALEARPDMFKSWDNDYDSTYADFMFRVEETEELRAAMNTAHLADKQEAQRRLHSLISEGYESPLAVMPVNPSTREKMTVARNAIHALQEEHAQKRRKDFANRVSRPDYLTDDVREHAFTLVKKPITDWDEADQKIFAKATSEGINQVKNVVDKAKKLEALRESNASLVEEIKAGKVPPAAMARIGTVQELEAEVKVAEKNYRSSSEYVRKAQTYLREEKTFREKSDKLMETMAVLEDALHWPGDPKKMPAELKPQR